MVCIWVYYKMCMCMCMCMCMGMRMWQVWGYITRDTCIVHGYMTRVTCNVHVTIGTCRSTWQYECVNLRGWIYRVYIAELLLWQASNAFYTLKDIGEHIYIQDMTFMSWGFSPHIEVVETVIWCITRECMSNSKCAAYLSSLRGWWLCNAFCALMMNLVFLL